MARKSRGKPPLLLVADTSGLDAFLDGLMQDMSAAVRPAAQAGAQVLYDAAKENVGRMKQHTGNLYKSIYQKFVPEQSVDGQNAFYRISWNLSKAPHGHLLEWGYLQRYRYYQNAQGQVRPLVRPGMDGRKKPAKSASQATKDAYYVTLPTPIQVPGRAFMRQAADKFPQAIAAAELELVKRLHGMTS
jgi:hypothetical protein